MGEETYRVALMSLHPVYANAILEGQKTVEFRKRPLADDVRHVVMYATKPVAQVVGVFQIASQDSVDPLSAWLRFGAMGAIEQDAFFRYFEGTEYAVAIGVTDVVPLQRGVPLEETTGVKRPPQSFQYLGEGPAVLSALGVKAPLRLARDFSPQSR